MRTGLFWKLVRLGAVCALLFLTLYALNGSKRSRERPVPLPDEDYRLLSPQTYKYVLNQPHVCNSTTHILVVFLVPVAPGNYAQREAVRQTWGAPGADTRTLFFLGLPEEGALTSQTQAHVEAESKQHQDIIQLDFVDTYPNLTIKTLMMMHWLHVHCPRARYGMKVDGDVFVNIFYLKDYLQTCPSRNFITGSVINDGTPKRDIRNKWHVSKQQFPGPRFPPYVSGAGYVFSWDLAGRISWASRFVKPVPLEDVYVGLCLRLIDVRPRKAYRLLPWPANLFVVGDLKYQRCLYARVIIVNGLTPSDLHAAWKDFQQGYSSC